MITKEQLIDKEIIEIPNFLTEKEAGDFYYLANTCTWEYGRVSNTFSGQRQSRMAYYFDPNDFVYKYQPDLWNRIKELFGRPVSLDEAYINYGDHATVNLSHCDGRQDGATFLICLNKEWNKDWSGLTVFYESVVSNKIIKAIVPEPGKATIFNPPIWHGVTPIAHWAESPRFMLALRCLIK